MKRTSDQAERDSSGRHAYSLFCTIGALPGRTRLLALALKCEHDRSARNYAYQVLLIDEWRGPVQLLKSGTIDAAKGTITLPLYQGSLAGSNKTVWYILTDVDDQGVATLLGLGSLS